MSSTITLWGVSISRLGKLDFESSCVPLVNSVGQSTGKEADWQQIFFTNEKVGKILIATNIDTISSSSVLKFDYALLAEKIDTYGVFFTPKNNSDLLFIGVPIEVNTIFDNALTFEAQSVGLARKAAEKLLESKFGYTGPVELISVEIESFNLMFNKLKTIAKELLEQS